MDALTLYFERRWNREADVSSMATLDVDFLKGWNLRASTRLDEVTDTHRENNLSLVYDDPCKCYSFGIDYIHRNNFNATASGAGGQKETKWFFNFTFRGLGDYIMRGKGNFIHRNFEPLRPSEAYLRKVKRTRKFSQ
jgi:lipopolysaccharide assembly outer membrane protein LptD (OstA)